MFYIDKIVISLRKIWVQFSAIWVVFSRGFAPAFLSGVKPSGSPPPPFFILTKTVNFVVEYLYFWQLFCIPAHDCDFEAGGRIEGLGGVLG